MMFEDLTRLYGIRSLFTMRTNQDAVENLFSQLRFLAGNCRTFGRLQFEFVLRNFILGSGHQIPIEHAASVQLSPDPDPEVQLLTAAISRDMRQGIQPEPKVIVKYANDPIDSVGAMMDISDQGKEVTIMSFEFPEREGFTDFASSLGDEVSEDIGMKKEDIDISETDKFQPSEWLDLRNKKGQMYVYKDKMNTLVLMNERFLTFHKDQPDGISRKAGVVKDFANILKRDFPELDDHFLEKFARKRTLRRLKAIQIAFADKQEETLRARTKKLQYSRY